LPFTVGVGNNEHSRALVGRPDIEGRYLDGNRTVTEHVQVTPHRGQPSALAAGDVLDDDEAGPDLADDAGELAPEAGAGAFDAGAEPGC
jgi:hypothetical protein